LFIAIVSPPNVAGSAKLGIAYCLLHIGSNYSKTLVAERGAVIHLAYHKGIEGMAGIGAAPPRAAAGMRKGSTLSGGNLTAAEFEHVAVHIV
jgi:hypothetical protein